MVQGRLSDSNLLTLHEFRVPAALDGTAPHFTGAHCNTLQSQVHCTTIHYRFKYSKVCMSPMYRARGVSGGKSVHSVLTTWHCTLLAYLYFMALSCTGISVLYGTGVLHGTIVYLNCLTTWHCTILASVVPGSVQVPKNRTRGPKSFRTVPGTARIYESVLEPEPEPSKSLGQFQNLNCFGMSAPTFGNKSILFECVLGKNWSLIEGKKN